MNKPKFDFFEVVRIATRDDKYIAINGQLATVVGRTPTVDQNSWIYAVSVESDAKTWSCFENQLEWTGVFRQREDCFDGSGVTVLVDPHGRGSIKSDQTRK